MSDRFHRAARDGYLDLLRETTRKDCNSPDEDGMTPTLWAAYHGHLDALRLLVGRGGNPDKCDHYGNTALHWSAANGHMNCVSFLVNFGVNLWVLDNEFHTAKDRAGIAAREEILRFLDDAMGKQTALNRKQVASQKEKAVAKAEKRVKDYQNIQKKAAKKAEEDEKRLQKDRQRMEHQNKEDVSPTKHKIFNFNSIRRDSRLLYGAPATFNEIVGTGTATKKSLLGVHKKIVTKKKEDDLGEFKVGEVEIDGKRSTRSLAGLRRDSEIMYVPKYETWDVNGGQKRRLQDVFNQNSSELSRSKSESGILYEVEKETEEEEVEPIADRPSIFDRPGFGNVAFRQSIAGSLLMSIVPGREGLNAPTKDNSRDSIGSAGSLNGQPTPWGEEDPLKDDDDDDDSSTSPLFFFLSAHGLVEFFPRFLSESIDLDSLMLLTEEDLIETFEMPLGPRRKLLKAIADRRSALEEPGEIIDSRL